MAVNISLSLLTDEVPCSVLLRLPLSQSLPPRPSRRFLNGFEGFFRGCCSFQEILVHRYSILDIEVEELQRDLEHFGRF